MPSLKVSLARGCYLASVIGLSMAASFHSATADAQPRKKPPAATTKAKPAAEIELDTPRRPGRRPPTTLRPRSLAR